MPVDISITIANHNGRDMLDRCLDSIYGNPPARAFFETIVVDNASRDGSAAMAREKYPLAVIIENEVPLGFAANQNKAMSAASGEFFLLLNNDAELFPGTLDSMADFMRANPRAGLAGPRLLNADGSVQESCFRAPTLAVLFYDAFFISSVFPGSEIFGGFKRWAHDAPRRVPSLSGACLMARRSAVAQVGPLDESFFMYFEDHDWCLRFRRAGWEVWFAPVADVVHIGGGSEGVLGHDKMDRFHSSLELFYRKHYGSVAAVAATLLNLTGAAFRAAAFTAAALLSTSRRELLSARASLHKRLVSWYLRGKK
jgi:hypothetical protein